MSEALAETEELRDVSQSRLTSDALRKVRYRANEEPALRSLYDRARDTLQRGGPSETVSNLTTPSSR